MQLFQQKKQTDIVFWGSFIFLVILGIITMISVSLDVDGSVLWSGRLGKQLIYVFIGLVLFITISIFDANIYRSYLISGGIYVLTFFSLILVKIAGPTINGVSRWLLIGGIQVQPSEFAKISLILLTASLYSNNEGKNQYKSAIYSLLFSLPIIVLVFIEPHGSMSILISILVLMLNFFILTGIEKHIVLLTIFVVNILGVVFLTYRKIYIGVIFLALSTLIYLFYILFRRIRWSKLLTYVFFFSIVLGLLGRIIGPIVWEKGLHAYQRERIITFLNPSSASRDATLNLEQSIVAVGSGKVLGKGWGSGTQSKLRFLPEYSTDFIFASFAEQFGFVGIMLLLSSFLILILKLVSYSYKSKYNIFFSIYLIGLSLKFTLEIFISIGTNIGLIPVTGLPLPFFSFGGTISLTTFISLGIAFSMIKSIREDNLNKYVDNNSFLI